MNEYQISICPFRLTLLHLRGRFSWQITLLEWTPLKFLLVSAALYVSLLALLTSRLRLVAFETLDFARKTAWK